MRYTHITTIDIVIYCFNQTFGYNYTPFRLKHKSKAKAKTQKKINPNIFVQTIKCIKCNRSLKQIFVVLNKEEEVKSQRKQKRWTQIKKNYNNNNKPRNHKRILCQFGSHCCTREWGREIKIINNWNVQIQTAHVYQDFKYSFQLLKMFFFSSRFLVLFNQEKYLFSITFYRSFAFSHFIFNDGKKMEQKRWVNTREPWQNKSENYGSCYGKLNRSLKNSMVTNVSNV